MVAGLTTPRPECAFVATKLAIVASGLLAFVEHDATEFLKELQSVGRGNLKCYVVPAYGYDIVVSGRLRIPIPAAKLQSGRTLMDHLAARGAIHVFVSGPSDLLATPALELSLEKSDLLSAKGQYEMAALLRSKGATSATSGPIASNTDHERFAERKAR